TYIEYYKQHYGINIKDPNQPLFVHRLKKSQMKDVGKSQLICLIPELCYMTGLTDEMRGDFRVMKTVAQYTRLSPDTRQQCLQKFARNINDNPEAKKILSDWGLTLDTGPVKLQGRVLPPEMVQFSGRCLPANEQADFSREAGREHVLVPV
ncbi:PAZ domain, partial [Trinorchestia longiramus]